MCKFNSKNDGRRIDSCMKNFIKNLNDSGIDTFGSCCGHGKYRMSVICKERKTNKYFDLISGAFIPRKKRFYKRDGKGYYFIPEVSR